MRRVHLLPLLLAFGVGFEPARASRPRDWPPPEPPRPEPSVPAAAARERTPGAIAKAAAKRERRARR